MEVECSSSDEVGVIFFLFYALSVSCVLSCAPSVGCQMSCSSGCLTYNVLKHTWLRASVKDSFSGIA